MNIAFRRITFLLAAALMARADVNVTGRVADENGVSVPNARVEFHDGSSGATATTGATGQFSAHLDREGDYTLRVECPGFFAIANRRVSFAAPQNQISITLAHVRELAESVEVRYSPPTIDPAETSDKKQLSNVEIVQAPYPASQDLRNALPLFQGVVQDPAGRLHVNGGETHQTNVTLDGFNLSDPVTGRFEARLNVDTVRSIDLETRRYSADKGRGSAGSLDIKTSMGDDRWRFSGTNFIPGISTESGLHINKWTPRLGLSGPIAKGRAWFHNGFDAFYDVDSVRELPRGENTSRSLTTSNLSRFQVNIKPSNILTASLLVNYVDANRNGLSFLSPVETTLDRRQNLVMTTLKYQVYLRRALLEFGFADSRSVTRESPQGAAPFEFLPSGRRGNYFVDVTRHSERQQWTANATLPSILWHGGHELRLGADVQRSAFDQATERHGYSVRRNDESVARHVTFHGSGLRAKTNFEPSLFLQDRWTPASALLIEAGVRTDWNQVTRTFLYSPRLSAAWAPRSLKDTKFAAGFGVYYDAISLGTITQHQDQLSLSTFYGRDGSVRRGPIATMFGADEQSLRLPRYQAVSLSVERKLPLDFYGKAGYGSRKGRRGFTFTEFTGISDFPFAAPAAIEYRLRNTRNDRYDAIELTAKRTFGGRFQWVGGYTRSSARSNAAVDYSLEDPIFATQTPGPYSWDAPNRFLTWGWAPLPQTVRLFRKTEVAYLAEYRTGFPFTVVNEEGSLVGRPNQVRFPAYFNVNLHFERKFRVMQTTWAWRFGINNLTNNGNPNVVNNNVDSSSYLVYGRGQQRAVNVRLRFLGRR
ncbi:MAG: TonB-dependent receptor [Bryobacterales bacterium]|nr:TonB-dependent receptor [Bryobacterales bacterium]